VSTFCDLHSIKASSKHIGEIDPWSYPAGCLLRQIKWRAAVRSVLFSWGGGQMRVPILTVIDNILMMSLNYSDSLMELERNINLEKKWSKSQKRKQSFFLSSFAQRKMKVRRRLFQLFSLENVFFRHTTATTTTAATITALSSHPKWMLALENKNGLLIKSVSATQITSDKTSLLFF